MHFSKQFRTRISLWLLAIIVPIFLIGSSASAQSRVKAPVKLKIEDGDFDGVTVVLKNNTSGESNSLPGVAKFDLDLKMNCDYIISFSKPGYITKRIAFNTTSPADRVSQGYYPFNFEVNLFKQYDGVNIVVFNQPVGKISFNRLIDDFDYDTDYTKQIQSALKLAEDEIKKKQQEERALLEKNKKLEEKRKQEEIAQAKADEKLRLQNEKKAAEESRILAAEEAKKNKLAEDQRIQLAKATVEEEKRQLAVAKMEEEERAKLKAAEESETRPGNKSSTGSESNSQKAVATSGNDQKPVAGGHSGEDIAASGKSSTAENEKAKGQAGIGFGDEDRGDNKATAIKKQDAGIVTAKGTVGQDEGRAAANVKNQPLNEIAPNEYEKLPGITVEEIVESSRKIIKVTVRKNEKETIFSKVVYNWGGVYYFRSNLSISQSMYKSATGLN
jgi:hypothetical protein